jgi:hypothetical protein
MPKSTQSQLSSPPHATGSIEIAKKASETAFRMRPTLERLLKHVEGNLRGSIRRDL